MSDITGRRRRAKSGSNEVSFDHVVGSGEEGRRHVEA
jgi:hypothetical protein